MILIIIIDAYRYFLAASSMSYLKINNFTCQDIQITKLFDISSSTLEINNSYLSNIT
jgi:hypothetical protein